MNNKNTFLSHIQKSFAVHEDPVRASQQKRYMKSGMLFWGMRMPQVRAIAKLAAKVFRPQSYAEYHATILNTITQATHREEWYAAMQYAREHTQYISDKSLPTYIEMVRATQWWDTIDEISTHLVGAALIDNPNLEKYLNAWIVDDNMWVRRIALLTQLKYKDKTNIALLKKLILTVAHEKEFFIRKAIGWALRQYSYTDPRWVAQFITENENVLSNLSQREGLKAIKRADKKNLAA